MTRGLPVAAICGAVDYLAQHGFLEGYKHTGNARFLWHDFPNYQTPDNFYERQAVSDRNLVTANGTASLEFTEYALQLTSDSLIQAKKKLIYTVWVIMAIVTNMETHLLNKNIDL